MQLTCERNSKGKPVWVFEAMSLIEIADPPTRTASSTSTSEVPNDHPTVPNHSTRREKEGRAKYVAAGRQARLDVRLDQPRQACCPDHPEAKPRFVVDFGCGRNDLVRDLRRLGIDGLGVDFAFPDADLIRPMHKTALHAGVADVVTSFDALEHLLPEDVDAVLAEMRRVTKPRGTSSSRSAPGPARPPSPAKGCTRRCARWTGGSTASGVSPL